MEISGLTRTGRVYKLEDLVDAAEMRRKGKELVEERQKKKRVYEDKTVEFIKIVMRSECLVVEQLKKLPKQFSMLSLLLSSKAHKATMLKILTSLLSRKG